VTAPLRIPLGSTSSLGDKLAYAESVISELGTTAAVRIGGLMIGVTAGTTPVTIDAFIPNLQRNSGTGTVTIDLYDETTTTVLASATSAGSDQPMTLRYEGFLSAGQHRLRIRQSGGTSTVPQSAAATTAPAFIRATGIKLADAARSKYMVDPDNTSEKQVLLTPVQQQVGDGTKRATVFCRGAASNALQVFSEAAWECARRGSPLVAREQGAGINTWGNDFVMTRITQQVAYAQGAMGGKSDKVIMFGFSMGGLNAINWASRNPSKVAALVLVCPVLNLVAFHDTNRGGYQANIESAYTNLAGYNAAVAGRDPMQIAAAGGLAGIPIKIWYSTDDTLSLPTEVDPFITAVSAIGGAGPISKSSMGAGGHLLTPAPSSEIGAFIAPYV
jgi:alpha/beta hydrolase fold